jgi:hypothetical protein
MVQYQSIRNGSIRNNQIAGSPGMPQLSPVVTDVKQKPMGKKTKSPNQQILQIVLFSGF